MDAADREINAHVMASPLIRPWWAASRSQREPNSLKKKKNPSCRLNQFISIRIMDFYSYFFKLDLFRECMVKKIETILLISDVKEDMIQFA